MFAFVIVDLRRDPPILFLARDHFGIKPLYYAHRDGRMAAASEVKALLAVPGITAEVDPRALAQYLTFLWVPDPRTMFRGVHKLPAGHYAVLRQGELKITQYWDLEFPRVEASYPSSEAELIEGVRHHLRRSVESQMISDVSLGAFLSAGMDSSSIVAMMRQSTREPVRTFTITYAEKYRVGEKTLDDPRVAARLAAHLGCQHTEMVVEPQVAELLPKLVWHMDEPIADPATLACYLVCREARKQVTVLLSGVGGDEVFGGYRKYCAYYAARLYRKLPAAARAAVEALALRLPPWRGTPLKGTIRLARKMARSASLPPQDAFLMNCTYLSRQQIAELCRPGMAETGDGFDAAEQHRDCFRRVAHADFLDQMLYLDTKIFMVSLNLTYNDKMSMASSVEARVPFLDRELVEFAAQRISPGKKISGSIFLTTKSILRQAMRGILPDEVLRQPKAAFAAPVDYWLACDLREMVDDLLSERQVRQRGYFEPAQVRRLIEEQRSGRQDWSAQLWQLLTFELWLRAFVDHGAQTPEAASASVVPV